MERKIGDIFIYKGKQIKVGKDVTNDCEGCVFKVESKCDRKLEDIQNLTGDCNHYSRSDTTNVIFKELKEINKMQEEKEITIPIPEGYEIDKERSSFEKIVFKKKEKEIKTWKDLVRNNIAIKKGFFINNEAVLVKTDRHFQLEDKNVFIDEKHAKSALAMAQISMLMPYYGGAITAEEWEDASLKYIIYNYNNTVRMISYCRTICLLAFHTLEQRNRFLENNRELVEDYLMI